MRVLCLGIHGIWRAGGTDAGFAGFRRREPVQLERTIRKEAPVSRIRRKDQEERCLSGSFSGYEGDGVAG